MTTQSLPASWARPYYQEAGGRPYLYYGMFGKFKKKLEIDPRQYRSLGIHAGLCLQFFTSDTHSDVLTMLRMGPLWEMLVAQNASLSRKVSDSDQCLILRGELEDQSTLDYFRDSVGLLTFLLDHGGICIYDPSMFQWWGPEAWRSSVFEPGGPVPHRHVVILASEEDGPGPSTGPPVWFHTRGMRKFGRPDLSVHNVQPCFRDAVIDMIERFIDLQAFGGTIAEGMEIKMASLPSGMRCHHQGSLDDPDFNNVHIEITSLCSM